MPLAGARDHCEGVGDTAEFRSWIRSITQTKDCIKARSKMLEKDEKAFMKCITISSILSIRWYPTEF